MPGAALEGWRPQNGVQAAVANSPFFSQAHTEKLKKFHASAIIPDLGKRRFQNTLRGQGGGGGAGVGCARGCEPHLCALRPAGKANSNSSVITRPLAGRVSAEAKPLQWPAACGCGVQWPVEAISNRRPLGPLGSGVQCQWRREGWRSWRRGRPLAPGCAKRT